VTLTIASLVLVAALPVLPVSSASPVTLLQETQAAPAVKDPGPPKTIGKALEKAAWNPEQRGPLLVVAPDELVSKPLWMAPFEAMAKNGGRMDNFKPPFPVPAGNGQYRVPELADFYGRRLVRLKGITVLAPETMMVLSDNPGKPDIYAGMRREQKIQMFQATMTEAQWALLGSKQGLGVGDLQQDQRDLFMACLPDPMIIMRGTAMDNGGTRFGGQEGSEPPARLVGDQRLAVRLRMSRTISMALFQKSGTQVSGMVRGQRPGTEVLMMQYSGEDRSENKAFGQVLRRDMPTVLKPQQIDFDAAVLNPSVSLSGVKTLGEMVERIRTATKLTLLVDPRLAKQPVWLKAGPESVIRAGDLLRALCWSVAGAVRYLPEGRAFLLTDDLVGWGTRVARIQAWTSMADGLRQAQIQKYTEAIRKHKPTQYLKFDDKDPMSVNPERMAEIEGKWANYPGRYEGISVPFTSLTEEQQQLVTSSANAHNNQFTSGGQAPSEYNQMVGTNQVRMTMAVRLFFSVPGVGDVEDQNSSWSLMESMLPQPTQMTMPEAPKANAETKGVVQFAESAIGGVLKIAPTEENQAREAVRVARERGFRQVWITMPTPKFDEAALPGEEAPVLPDYDRALLQGKALLTAAIAEANTDTKKPISVVAVTSVLTAMPLSRTVKPVFARNLDRNLLGETASPAQYRQIQATALMVQGAYAEYMEKQIREWILPDTPTLKTRLSRYLSDLARVPGLSGMALTDTAASGYESQSADSEMYFGGGNSQLGYVPSYRAPFLLANSYDPIDIAPRAYIDGVDLKHPFLGQSTPSYSNEGIPIADERSTIGARWNKARFQHVADLMVGIYSTLDADKKLLRKTPAVSGQSAIPGGAALEGTFPLYLMPSSSSYRNYVLWDRKEFPGFSPPAMLSVTNFREAAYKASRAVSSRCLFTYIYVDPSLYTANGPNQVLKTPKERAEQFAAAVNQMLQYSQGNWDGYVLDLSSVSVEEMPTLLSVVRFGPTTKRKAVTER
jgi:hypothetical protein